MKTHHRRHRTPGTAGAQEARAPIPFHRAQAVGGISHQLPTDRASLRPLGRLLTSWADLGFSGSVQASSRGGGAFRCLAAASRSLFTTWNSSSWMDACSCWNLARATGQADVGQHCTTRQAALHPLAEQHWGPGATGQSGEERATKPHACHLSNTSLGHERPGHSARTKHSGPGEGPGFQGKGQAGRRDRGQPVLCFNV